MKNFGSTQVTRAEEFENRATVRRAVFPLIAALAALSLAACETRSSSSGDGIAGSLFGSSDGQQSAPQSQDAQIAAQVKPLTFAPVIGAPARVASQMSEKLVSAASAKNLRVESSNSTGYTVRGYLVAASAPNGTKLSYIWDIRDQSGKRAQRFQGDELIEGKKGGDPWALVDEPAIDRIAASTAEKISSWMYGGTATAGSGGNAPQTSASSPEPQPQPRQSAQVQAAQPTAQAQPAPTASTNVLSASAPAEAAQGEIVAVVPPVTGAPGDGEESLTTAMRRHLRSAGVKLVEGSAANAYTVKGSVQLGSEEGGQQPITIRWLVVDPSGKQIDKAVVQRNKIPAGSLDGPWGKVAELAASEAAKSVAKLIQPTS